MTIAPMPNSKRVSAKQTSKKVPVGFGRPRPNVNILAQTLFARVLREDFTSMGAPRRERRTRRRASSRNIGTNLQGKFDNVG